MRKEFRTFIAFSGLALSLAALPASAADFDTVRVKVPFEFTAGKATLPAGEYLVSQQFDSHVVTISGKGGDAILMAWTADSPQGAKASTVTFARTAKGIALTGVHMPGNTADGLRFAAK